MAKVNLDRFKYEVASEIGYFPSGSAPDPQAWNHQLDQSKYEVAQELGIDLKHGYNGEMTSRDAGAIGGRLGGHLGGQMVKRMIQLAEEQLVRGYPPE